MAFWGFLVVFSLLHPWTFEQFYTFTRCIRVFSLVFLLSGLSVGFEVIFFFRIPYLCFAMCFFRRGLRAVLLFAACLM